MAETELLNTLLDEMKKNILPYTESIIQFVLIIIVGRILIHFIMGYLKSYFKKSDKIEETIERFIYGTSRTVSYALVFMIALGSVGVDVAPLIAGFGVAGFVVGFALKDLLSNLVAGGLLLFYKPFRVGDVIETVKIKGRVEEIDAMMCKLYTEEGLFVAVPNAKVWGAPIKNYSKSKSGKKDLS